MRHLATVSSLLSLAACNYVPRTQSSAPPVEVSARPRQGPPLSGGTASPVDWEQNSVNSLRTNAYIRPDVSSPRTLAQTTSWMNWALDQYGFLSRDAFSTSASSFDGCSMTWTTLHYFDMGQMVNENIFRVNLKDIDVSYGSINVAGDSVRISTRDSPVGLLKLQERFWEKKNGRMVTRAADRFTTERAAVIPLSRVDGMPLRFGTALVHAVKLCGGTGRMQ